MLDYKIKRLKKKSLRLFFFNVFSSNYLAFYYLENLRSKYVDDLKIFCNKFEIKVSIAKEVPFMISKIINCTSLLILSAESFNSFLKIYSDVDFNKVFEDKFLIAFCYESFFINIDHFDLNFINKVILKVNNIIYSYLLIFKVIFFLVEYFFFLTLIVNNLVYLK